jgi:hypothetical protein
MRVLFFILIITIVSCQDKVELSQATQPETPKTIKILSVPNTTVNLNQLVLKRLEGQWKLDSLPFSGFGLAYFPNGKLKSKIGFVNGKKEGQAEEYFEDGHLRNLTSYHENLMHGEVKNWSGAIDHHKLAIRHFYLGKPHGVHKKWYPNGNLMKIITYQMGKEEGLQQAFLENGKLYANYEARDGRTFGLKRSMLCYELEDGNLKSNN